MRKDLPPYLYDALEEIDAAIFSGEALHLPYSGKLKSYLDRWQRAFADHRETSLCYYNEDGMLCNLNGTRSIFDDVDE